MAENRRLQTIKVRIYDQIREHDQKSPSGLPEGDSVYDITLSVAIVALFFLSHYFSNTWNSERDLSLMSSLWTNINSIAFFVVAFMYGIYFSIRDKELSFFSFFQTDDVLNYYGIRELYHSVLYIYLANCIIYVIYRVVNLPDEELFIILCYIGIILTIESIFISLAVVIRLLLIDRFPQRKYNILNILYRVFEVSNVTSQSDCAAHIKTDENAFMFLWNEYMKTMNKMRIHRYRVDRLPEEINEKWIKKQ